MIYHISNPSRLSLTKLLLISRFDTIGAIPPGPTSDYTNRFVMSFLVALIVSAFSNIFLLFTKINVPSLVITFIGFFNIMISY